MRWALENEEGMTQTRSEHVRFFFSSQHEVQACGGSQSPAYMPTHGLHFASVLASASGEFKQDYRIPSLGVSESCSIWCPRFLPGSVMSTVYQ
jgi:hypothetical protein